MINEIKNFFSRHGHRAALSIFISSLILLFSAFYFFTFIDIFVFLVWVFICSVLFSLSFYCLNMGYFKLFLYLNGISKYENVIKKSSVIFWWKIFENKNSITNEEHWKYWIGEED